MEEVKSRMLLCSEILQSMRQSNDIDKIFREITTKLLNLDQAGHVSVYRLDKLGE